MNNKTIIKAEIVAHSLSPQGDELISVLCTFPRIILAEVNTHRMLSKNTSSSRAIPFNKIVEVVKNDPFIPLAWQKDHTGMQGYEYAQYPDTEDFKVIWLEARDNAIKSAQLAQTGNIKLTKQLCNRLLESFMWTTMLITGNKESWENFFNLRCPVYYYAGNNKSYKSKKELLPILLNDFGESPVDSFWYNINKGKAEIHMMALAESIYDAVNESTPKQLQAGEWHIPFENKIDISGLRKYLNIRDTENINYKINKESYFVKISTAMAAHTSYTIVGGEAVKSPEKWIELHDKLVSYDPPHSSPMEHCARAMNDEEYDKFLKGYINFEVGYHTNELNSKNKRGWCNNLKGFIPYRYFIDNNLTI